MWKEWLNLADVTPKASQHHQQRQMQALHQLMLSNDGAPSGPSVALSIPSGASTQGNPFYRSSNTSVKKGDVITVTNNDNAPHTVTSGASATDPKNGKLFDTSIIMPGKTAKINTARLTPGIIPSIVTVHPYMSGTLTVKA